ncbi:MAG: hypothetical protein AABN95_01500 [Acidobacteriota bacterium]
MSGRASIIISDIHIGAGLLDDCDEELESHLCDFLQTLSTRAESIELIINGDFLDFVQAPPWKGAELESKTQDSIPLCHTEAHSRSKLSAIHQAHGAVFNSLGSFLASKADNRLVILPGNHDADFFWQTVRTQFIEKVSELDASVQPQIRFHLEQVYRPDDFPEVWIEHGHQHDPTNAFEIDDKPFWSEADRPIFRDVNGKERLFECIGTRLLIKYINELDRNYPFVDNVKPFGKFVALFCRSVFAPSYFIKAAAGMWGLLRFLSSITVHHRGDFMDSPEESEIDPRPVLMTWERALSSADKAALVKTIRARGFPLDRSLKLYVSDLDDARKLMDFLSQNLEIAKDPPADDSSFLGSGEGELSLYRGFKMDETLKLKKVAKNLLRKDGVKAVVMGHTHEVVDDPNLAYINSGCWTRYLDFRKSGKIRSWSVLKKNSYDFFPYLLNFVEINPGGSSLIQKKTFRERTS